MINREHMWMHAWIYSKEVDKLGMHQEKFGNDQRGFNKILEMASFQVRGSKTLKSALFLGDKEK